jgi:hypothetical protein
MPSAKTHTHFFMNRCTMFKNKGRPGKFQQKLGLEDLELSGAGDLAKCLLK